MQPGVQAARIEVGMSEICYTKLQSPVGPLLMAADENGLRIIHFVNGRRPRQPDRDWVEKSAAFKDVAWQLKEYFEGKRTEFDLPLVLEGTEFQMRVWNMLRKIPYGETTSYGKIARQIGSPDGARAVGLANGQNPIPIIIPCHRVIGSNGDLTGFGGGLPIRQKLLALESRQLSFL